MSQSIKVIFAISIAINILLLGMIIGYLSKQNFDHRPGCQVVDRFSPVSKKIFESKNEIFKYDREFRDQVEQASDEAFKVLVAEEFNRERYHQKLEVLRTLHRNKMNSFVLDVEDMAMQMPQEDRMILAKYLRHYRQKRPRY